jgi:hypothetical protein
MQIELLDVSDRCFIAREEQAMATSYEKITSVKH